jgi:hypothetical protein
LRIRLSLILSAALGLGSSTALASWADFAPRPFENGAYFEVFGSRENDQSDNYGRSFRWTDTFFRERITLYSSGYFYHPRFLRYQVSISPGLKQELYTQSFLPSTGWTNSGGLDYDAKLMFLPEHPYNFELFALRREPLYMEQSATQHGSVETSYGAHFRYRRKPFFFHASVLDNSTDSRTTVTNVRRLGLDGQYFKRYVSGNELSVTAFFTPSRYSGNQGIEGDSTQYGVTGLLSTPKVRLDVTASKNLYDQSSALSGNLQNDQFTAQERLSATLPLNFRTDFFYRILSNTSTTPFPNSLGSRELSNFNQELQAIVSHRLYQSLDSRYIYLRASRDSDGGDSTVVSNSLGFDYSKMIPRGRVLAGVYVATSRTDNTGQTAVASEPHAATPVPGSFLLAQQNVQPGSLAVFVRSPLPPFQDIRLVENVNYTLTAIANTLQVNVYSLPPQFVVPGTYDFFVSYTLATGTFELRTNTYGFNTSVQLLDNMLTPYYSYLAVRSEVLSGAFPGVPLDSTTNTLGLNFVLGPWRAVGEYQTLDWAVSPYRSWRLEGQYIRTFDPTLRASAIASFLNKYYPDGTSMNEPTAYTDKSANIYANVQKDFLSRTLTLSGGVSYSRMFGLVDSNAWAVNSALIWKVGLFELSAGLDTYGSNTQGLNAGSSSRGHQYYYLKVMRRLF